MGTHKDELERNIEAQYAAAERDGRRCWACNAVIPYDVAKGPKGECPACVGALKDEESRE